jgi:hypothetical protein
LGWSLAIAGAALAAAVFTGGSLIVALIALGVVIVVSAFIPERGSEASSRPKTRTPGQPYSISQAWKIDRRADVADLAQALEGQGLGLSQKRNFTDEVTMWGGSQLRTRLFGGYFVDRTRLPVEVQLSVSSVDSRKWTVQLGVRDRLGVAIRDEALEDRLALAAEGIREATAAQLAPLGAVEVVSAPVEANVGPG